MLKVILAAIFATILVTLLALNGQERQDKKPAKPDPKAMVSFSKGVLPIIRKRCLPCHAADSDNPSLLVLESYKDLLKGGKHGSPVNPGKPKESLLIEKLLPDPPFGHQMPVMSRKKLEQDQVDSIAAWIDEGAKDN